MFDYRNINNILLLSYSLKYCQVDRRLFLSQFTKWNGRFSYSRFKKFVLSKSSTFIICCLILTIHVVADSPLRAFEVPSAPKGLVWESLLSKSSDYEIEVEALIRSYEIEVGQCLSPGDRKKVGLKINTRGRAGLSTPPELIRAIVVALQARGYKRECILIIDDSTYNLRQSGILPPVSQSSAHFEGCPVIALDTEEFYDSEWFYDSPLPPAFQEETQFIDSKDNLPRFPDSSQARKSLLPIPLIHEVDFWINLAVATDDPSLGVDGTMANASLWNVSNSRRFLVNQATASAAVAEILAIPELEERLLLHFVSLNQFQFIGGPYFNSYYTRSEPLIWMSSDPVALDRLIYERINSIRLLEGFPEINPVPRQLAFAASLGLGEDALERIQVIKLPVNY